MCVPCLGATAPAGHWRHVHLSTLLPFTALPALSGGPQPEPSAGGIYRIRLLRAGAAAGSTCVRRSAWVVVLVAVLQRRPTVSLCHQTSLVVFPLPLGDSR
jgi:hypothetical protein